MFSTRLVSQYRGQTKTRYIYNQFRGCKQKMINKPAFSGIYERLVNMMTVTKQVFFSSVCESLGKGIT